MEEEIDMEEAALQARGAPTPDACNVALQLTQLTTEYNISICNGPYSWLLSRLRARKLAVLLNTAQLTIWSLL